MNVSIAWSSWNGKRWGTVWSHYTKQVWVESTTKKIRGEKVLNGIADTCTSGKAGDWQCLSTLVAAIVKSSVHLFSLRNVFMTWAALQRRLLRNVKKLYDFEQTARHFWQGMPSLTLPHVHSLRALETEKGQIPCFEEKGPHPFPVKIRV